MKDYANTIFTKGDLRRARMNDYPNIIFTKGDLIRLAKDGEFDFMFHGANCQCTMGSGIALQVKNELPALYQVDQETRKGDRGKLGTMSIVKIGDCIYGNAYTQYDYNRSGEYWTDRFEYKAFDEILFTLHRMVVKFDKKMRFGLPMIGMGRAGGNSEKILGAIDRFAEVVYNFNGSTTTIVEYQSK